MMFFYKTDRKVGQARPKEISILRKQIKNKSIFVKIDLAVDPFNNILLWKGKWSRFFVEWKKQKRWNYYKKKLHKFWMLKKDTTYNMETLPVMCVSWMFDREMLPKFKDLWFGWRINYRLSCKSYVLNFIYSKKAINFE